MGLHTTAVRRLTGDDLITHEFASTWTQHDLDSKTRSLLSYASKLTDTPGMIERDDTEKLKKEGWTEQEVWEITALVSFFNCSGRMEAASGLPPDKIPDGAKFAEADKN